MVFGHKAKPQVDLSDFDAEKDPLYNFLQTKLKLNINKVQNKWQFDSENLAPEELQRVVNKYVYHHNLNTKYYVALQGSTVKLQKFKRDSKPEKTRKNPQSPTFAHGF
jgi:hypothetical protein